MDMSFTWKITLNLIFLIISKGLPPPSKRFQMPYQSRRACDCYLILIQRLLIGSKDRNTVNTKDFK